MKKPVIILFIVGAVAVITGALYLIVQPEKHNNAQVLSSRADEYIESQKNIDNPDWEDLQVKKGNTTASKNEGSIKNECFSFMVPFQVMSTRKGADCFVDVTIISPRGHLVAYQRKVSHANLEEDTGVTLRRKQRELYTESSHKVGNTIFIVFKKKPGDEVIYEKTAFLKRDELFVITLSAPTNRSLDKEFESILKTITFTPL
jgi:hypothetical protein